MKKLIIFIIAILLIIIGAFFLNPHFSLMNAKTVDIEDVTSTQFITLSKDESQGGAYGINILITGHIDGKATIKQSNEDKDLYAYEIDKGRVYLPIGGDWYGDKCLIRYEPADVKSGKLRIKYKFKTF